MDKQKQEEDYLQKKEYLEKLSIWEINDKVELFTDFEKREFRIFMKDALIGNLPYDD